MVKSLPKVIFHATKILITSLRKSIRQEIDLSKELARLRYQDQIKKNDNNQSGNNMSLDEAQKILNITTLDPDVIQKQYNYLFNANKNYKYLQSKIYRAREAIDYNLKNNNENGVIAENNIFKRSLKKQGNYLFFTYVLANDFKN